MTGSLIRLLPVHETREHRALRHSHELGLAHQRALSDQLIASRAVLRLRRSREQAQALALGSDAIGADHARAATEYAAALALRLAAAEQVLATRTEAARNALAAARQAQAAYAKQVRVNDMFSSAAAEQAGALARTREAAHALRDEDDFAPVWLAQQRVGAPKGRP